MKQPTQKDFEKMTAGDIYIKHWNENYGTDYGEGQAPHYVIAAMEEYALQMSQQAFNAARRRVPPLFETFQDYLNQKQTP